MKFYIKTVSLYADKTPYFGISHKTLMRWVKYYRWHMARGFCIITDHTYVYKLRMKQFICVKK